MLHRKQKKSSEASYLLISQPCSQVFATRNMLTLSGNSHKPWASSFAIRQVCLQTAKYYWLRAVSHSEHATAWRSTAVPDADLLAFVN